MLELAVVLGALASTFASALRTSREINTATDLARLYAKGTMLTATELKELNARIKTLEEIAKLEDCLRLLENQKRTSDAITSAASQGDPFIQNPSLALGFSGY
jgi:cell division protein ZapA (FtsZ GTPase activity inhibitor)